MEQLTSAPQEAPATPPETAESAERPSITVEEPIENLLVPGSAAHSKVLQFLNARAKAGEEHIDKRRDDWRTVDEHLRQYIDLEAFEKKGDRTEDTTRKENPWGRVVALPVTYANLQVRVVQEVGLLSMRNPQIEPAEGSDLMGAMLMEAVIGYNWNAIGPLSLCSQLCYDAERYGQAWVYDGWMDEWGWAVLPPLMQLDPQRAAMLPPEYRKFVTEPRMKWQRLRQRCAAEVIDPTMAIPDPRVPAYDPQAGEFFGHRYYAPYHTFVSLSQDNQGPYFNVQHLGRIQAQQGRDEQDTGRLTTGDFSDLAYGDNPGFLKARHLQVKLIPSMVGLGSEDRPQLWLFTWVGEGSGGVIVRAEKCTNAHQKFSYSAAQVNPDKHAPFTPGSGELIEGLERYVRWGMNAHILSTMHRMWGGLVVDDQLIERGDIENPGPDRLYRTTPLGHELVMMGSNPGQFFASLPGAPETSSFLDWSERLFQWSQRAMAASDPQQSMPLPSQRTLGEVQALLAAGSQRVTYVARQIDDMALKPLVERMMVNIQQYMEGEQMYRVAGELAKKFGADRVRVSREDLYGQFDYVPHTATSAPDPGRQADWGLRLMEMAGKSPAIAQILNVRPLLEHVFTHVFGVKYIDQFFNDPNMQPGMPGGPQLPPGVDPRMVQQAIAAGASIAPRVMHDEEIQRRVKAGTMVPVGGQR